MNDTFKYTPAIMFGSSDSEFTTNNPRVGAVIVGYATQAYNDDNGGGMGREFRTGDNNNGEELTTALTITNGQSIILANQATDGTHAVRADRTINLSIGNSLTKSGIDSQALSSNIS